MESREEEANRGTVLRFLVLVVGVPVGILLLLNVSKGELLRRITNRWTLMVAWYVSVVFCFRAFICVARSETSRAMLLRIGALALTFCACAIVLLAMLFSVISGYGPP